MRNETELIKSTAKRQLTAKGYKFLSRCVSIAAKQRGLTRYHSEFKPVKEQIYKLILSLIIDEKQSIEQIKEMVKNRNHFSIQ